MTTEPEGDRAESADVRAARAAIEAHLKRADPGAGGRPDTAGTGDPGGSPDTDTGTDSSPGAGTGTGEERDSAARGDRRVDDATAERIAREAWDAVLEAAPPPPDPDTDRAPARSVREPAEVTERRRRAIAVSRGLKELGYPLDETLLPGPDMAAG